jgi:predicted RNase H-like nuclease (RuvC/YqgF family)
MTKKPTTVKEWEKVCENLNSALQSTMKNEDALKKEIEEIKLHWYSPVEFDQEIEEYDAQVEQLEEQLTMSVGVIKYLEMKLERTNSV